jgi:hypothetical protein
MLIDRPGHMRLADFGLSTLAEDGPVSGCHGSLRCGPLAVDQLDHTHMHTHTHTHTLTHTHTHTHTHTVMGGQLCGAGEPSLAAEPWLPRL